MEDGREEQGGLMEGEGGVKQAQVRESLDEKRSRESNAAGLRHPEKRKG